MGRLRRPGIPEVCDGLFDALDAEARGDPEALAQWMRDAHPALVWALANFVRAGEDPEDLASEIICAAVRSHRRYGRPEVGGARWISGAAAYLCDRLRRKGRWCIYCDLSEPGLLVGDFDRGGAVRRTTSDPAADAAEALDLDEAIRRFNAALWKLPQPEARILQLSLVHGLTIAEIQEHLDRWIRAETGGKKRGPGWEATKKRLEKARGMLDLVLAGQDLAAHYPRLAFRRAYSTTPPPFFRDLRLEDKSIGFRGGRSSMCRAMAALAFVIGLAGTLWASARVAGSVVGGEEKDPINSGNILGEAGAIVEFEEIAAGESERWYHGSLGAEWSGQQFASANPTPVDVPDMVQHFWVKDGGGAPDAELLRVMIDTLMIMGGTCSRMAPEDPEWWWSPTVDVDLPTPLVEQDVGGGNWSALSPADTNEQILGWYTSNRSSPTYPTPEPSYLDGHWRATYEFPPSANLTLYRVTNHIAIVWTSPTPAARISHHEQDRCAGTHPL